MSNDLYSGLIRGVYHKDKYWGSFEDLNNISIPSSVDALRLQLDRLEILIKKSSNYTNIKNFLDYANRENPESLHNNIEEKTLTQIYSRIIQILNLGLWSNPDNLIRATTDQATERRISLEQAHKEADQILHEASILLETAKVEGHLSQEIMNVLEIQLKKQTWKGKYYTQMKADYAEKLMVDFLSKNPSWKALQTGQMTFEGQQLIQDALAFDFSIDLNDGSFTVNGDKNNPIFVKNLNDFFTKIKGLDGKYSIQLSDTLYDALLKASALKAQAKSGRMHQLILNKNKKNSISLRESVAEEKYYKLETLFKIQARDRVRYFKKDQHSQDLAALANYTLSKAIGKTAIIDNDIYFTEDGIMTAREWMKKYCFYLHFTQDVNTVSSNFTYVNRAYSLAHI